MPEDFSGENLRGRSFKGEDLSGANFSGADIRGANFTSANLKDANFQNAQAGLQKRWVLILTLLSWLLSLISVFLFVFNGVVIAYIFDSSASTDSQFVGWVALIATIIVYIIIIYQGIGVSLTVAIVGAFAVTGAFAVAGAFAFAFAFAGSSAFAAAVARAFAIAFGGAFVFAVAIAGAFAGAFALASARAVAVGGAVAVVGVLSLLGAVAGERAVASTGSFAGAVAGAVGGGVAGAIVSVYITWRAMEGDKKYALVRDSAIAFAAIRGTSFRDANLTDANFNEAKLKSTDLRDAKLIRTNFHKTKLIDRVRPGTSYLQYPKVRQLALTRKGQEQELDGLNLRGINLKGALLTDASFIGTDLSEACLQETDLSRAQLKQTQLDGTDFTGATLTGAYIEDWNITNQTKFDGVRCKCVYMRLPTKENPDPWRKPDNRDDVFEDGEFGDFIKPIVDTLDLYHSQGVDPRAITIAYKELAENNPDAELEIVAMEKIGEDKFLLRSKTAPEVGKSELSAEYFEIYNDLKSLSPSEQIKYFFTELKIKDSQINWEKNDISRIENMIYTLMERSSVQVQNIYSQGDIIMPEGSKKVSNFDLKGSQFAGGLVNADTVNADRIGGDITNYGQQQKETQTETNNSTVKTILILASNPKNTSQLRLDEEVREIDAGLQRAKKRELFDLKQRWAVRVQDVYQAMLDFQPQIVHFSGHGTGDDGLALEDEFGKSKLVDTQALAKLFELFSTTIECVVFNACYSEVQAEAIVKHIPYVIGMNQAIGDRASVKFATGFYNALGAGESVEFAYKLGCNVIQLDGIPEHLTPVLKKKYRTMI